jgi:hypothetical protein
MIGDSPYLPGGRICWWQVTARPTGIMLPGDGTLADGSILYYIQGADEGQGPDLHNEFNLLLSVQVTAVGDRAHAVRVAPHRRWGHPSTGRRAG